MDQSALAKLDEAGIDPSMERLFLSVPIRVDGGGEAIPIGEEVPVLSGEMAVVLRLKRISELFVGSAVPPSFSSGPTPAYVLFFALIERTAIDFCSCTGKIERDQEFERLYRHLRRRPDGQDYNPLFSYIQAAARLYMSLRDVSRAEFEGVAHRLCLSASHFAMGATSTNYYEIVGAHVGIGPESD